MRHGRVGSQSPKSKAYRLYNPLSGKVLVSRDVQFNEEECWTWSHDSTAATQAHISDVFPPEPESVESENSGNSTPTTSSLQSGNNSPLHSSPPTSLGNMTSSEASSPSSSSSESPPRKTRSLSEVYATCDFALYASDPTCYDEAAQSQVWLDAMREEMSAI